MELQARYGGQTWHVDIEHPIDISRPLHFARGREAVSEPQPFGLPPAHAEAVLSLAAGSSCQCDTLTITPHGNGTHTECAAHVWPDRKPLRDALCDTLMVADLITVRPLPLRDDQIIERASLQAALPQPSTAVVVRTSLDQPMGYSNPPYLAADAALWLRSVGVRHLLLDLPSADRADDGGAMAAHKAFFGDDDARTITEMACIDSHVPDGRYLLNLQIAPFMLDAAPSRPVLFRLVPDV